MPGFLQLTESDFQLAPQQHACPVCAALQDLLDAEEDRFVILDDTSVGRKAHLAIGECEQGVDRPVGGHPRSQVDHDLHELGRVVLYPLDLDLALVIGFEDAVNQGGRGHTVGQFLHDEGLVVLLADLGPHPDAAAAQAIVVLLAIRLTPGREIRQQFETAPLQVGHGPVDDFVEIVRQHLAGKAHGDALRSLLKQQWKFDGKRLRLLVAAIIAGQPVCRLRIEQGVLCEGAEAGLDVTGCGRTVAREDVAPVALTVQHELLLADLHHRIPDARVTVGVVLHRVADGVGHLVEASIIQLPQRMQDTPLYGLQTVMEVGHRPLEDDV